MAIAASLYPPGYVFRDSSDNPLAAGSVYFYASGTSTPQNTYSDSALSVPNTNPIVLNASGYSTNNIFGLDAGYSVVVKDANGVQQGGTITIYGVAKPDF